MGKYLKLGPESTGDRWTLPDHADVEKIRAALAEAMDMQSSTRIRVVVGKDQTSDLLVNGRTLEAALVWEDVPPGGGMTIID
jgi:hypothetical protein